MRRILLVYFSRTGHTRQVATAIAAALARPGVQVDVEEIVDPTPRRGVLGYFRSGGQAYFRRVIPIAASVRDPAAYDLVIIGSPIWNVSLSAPVRSYLARHREALRIVAFFCTCGGMGMDRTLRQMAEAAGREAVGSLVVRERDLGQPLMASRVARFAVEIGRVTTPALRAS
jgi:flavodoxin